jgi:hypothetical protein
LRQTHKRRADEWYDEGYDGSPQESYFQHSHQPSERRSATDFRASTSLSLSDLVPLFIGLSAARSNIGMKARAHINKEWMHLAGQFMLQAALEQCLIYGQVSPEKLREIFSWGWKENISTAWYDEESVNDMFFDDGSRREVHGWKEIRRQYLKLVRRSN